MHEFSMACVLIPLSDFFTRRSDQSSVRGGACALRLEFGAGGRDRTYDKRIMTPLLYR